MILGALLFLSIKPQDRDRDMTREEEGNEHN